MKNEKFRGTGVAIVTPFKSNGDIDFKAFKHLIEFQIQGGINFLVVLGTTGESPSITDTEREEIFEFVKEVVEGRVPVVVGIGGNSTKKVIETLKKTSFDGIDAVLSVAPYYNKPSQEGFYMHYKMVGEASPVPVIMYNVPGRTGKNMTAETTLRLASRVSNLIAVKEASGNMSQIMQIIKNKPNDFMVISGDDALTMPLLALGADGVISVVANAYPKQFSEMVQSGLQGDFQKARQIHYQLLDITEALFAEGSPAGIKALLNIQDKLQNAMRLPITPVSQRHYNLIEKLQKQI